MKEMPQIEYLTTDELQKMKLQADQQIIANHKKEQQQQKLAAQLNKEQQQKTLQEQKHFQQKTKKPLIETIKEAFGYDTLNPLMYKWFNAILLINMLIFAISALTLGAIYLINNNYIKMPEQINSILTQNMPFYIGIIITTMALLILIINFAIVSTTLKRNDLIVIRKFRAGSGTISKTNLKGKSTILFDKKDHASKVLISWAGAITDTISGCKIIQISEGHPTNDNLNQQVTESEWDKDVSRLTKAKSVADLAEAELFNQGLLGLKWQDLLLIIIAIIGAIALIYLIAGSPDQIAKKTIEGLMNGNIQNAVTTSIQNSGLLGNPVPIK